MSKTARDIVIPGRLSYPALFQPRQVAQDSDKKNYQATLLIPKSDANTVAIIQAAIQAAVDQGVADGKFKQPIDPNQTKYPPLRDGDSMNSNGEPRGAEFAGHWFISSKAPENRKPFVVDANVQPVIQESDVYAGCYVNAALQFFPYSHATGGKGISVSLQGIQKARDGEPLGGGIVEASDVFSALPGAGAAQPTGGFGQPAQAAAQQPAQQAAPGLGF